MKYSNCESFPLIHSSIYGGMFNHSGYSVQIDSEFEEKALFFDGQFPSTDEIILEPGSISMANGYSFTPGTLIVKESGTYAIDYSVNALSRLETKCRILVTVDHALLLNSMTLLQMHPDELYLFSRTVYYNLKAGSQIQLVLYASKPSSIIIGGNLSQLFVHRLSE